MSRAGCMLFGLSLICEVFGHKWDHVGGGLYWCRRCFARMELPSGQKPAIVAPEKGEREAARQSSGVPSDWLETKLGSAPCYSFRHPSAWHRFDEAEKEDAARFAIRTAPGFSEALVAIMHDRGILSRPTEPGRLRSFVESVLASCRARFQVRESRVEYDSRTGPHGRVYEVVVPFYQELSGRRLDYVRLHFGTVLKGPARALMVYSHQGVSELPESEILQARRVFDSIRVEE